MNQTPSHAPEYREYFAWDVPTRWFHWINALAVLGLIATGLVILNEDALGLSAGGKILLKSIHVSFGYVMAVNLLWRFIWAFFGTATHDGEASCREALAIWRHCAPMRLRSCLESRNNSWDIIPLHASGCPCSSCSCSSNW